MELKHIIFQKTTLRTQCGNVVSHDLRAIVEHEGASFEVQLPEDVLVEIEMYAKRRGRKAMEEFVQNQANAQS
jgi:hypothetical protein